MVELDPIDHEIAELGPQITDVDDADELREMLELEENDENRMPVKQLIQSRLEALEEDDETDPSDVDLTEVTIADIANMIRDSDDVDLLEKLLAEEKDGKERKGAISQIESRIESVAGTDESESQAVEYVPPEEKYPDLDHPTADKQYVEGVAGETYRDMWVYCETQEGKLIDVSKEMLGRAREMMDAYNSEDGAAEDTASYGGDETGNPEAVIAVIIGEDVGDLAEEAIAYGADRVLYHEDDRLGRFRHKPYMVCVGIARGGRPRGRGLDPPRTQLPPRPDHRHLRR